jgi:hypothetical protein
VVAPTSSVPPNGTMTVLLTAASTHDAAKKDAVKAVTTRAPT